jgi:hypothetical protein
MSLLLPVGFNFETLTIATLLAHLSNELFKKSSQVFSNAKITTFYAEMSGFNDERPHHEYVMEAKNFLAVCILGRKKKRSDLFVSAFIKKLTRHIQD